MTYSERHGRTTLVHDVDPHTLKEGETTPTTIVEETDHTILGAPVILVDGFQFVGDLDYTTDDPEATHWLSGGKTTFVLRGRLYQRVDRTRAFAEYFGLRPYVEGENGKLVPLSEDPLEPSKG